MAEPIYNLLYSANLTRTESLSLFDVIQITAIITLVYAMNKARIRLISLDNKLQALHREVSIIISKMK